MRKIALTTLVTSAVWVAIMAAGGLSASRVHVKTLSIGNAVEVPGLDLWCSTYASDPGHRDPGPVMYCDRASDLDKNSYSAGVAISRYHIRLAESGSRDFQYSVTRSP